MIEKRPCPHCEALRDVELVERDETVTVKGRDVQFRAALFRCTTCGEEFESPEQLDANLSAAREAYSRLYESPSPEQLIAIRSRYSASQKAFGLILGFGELTMNSYEQGATPESTNRLLLKLAENPVSFKAMYAVNSARIGALQRQRIESSEAFRSAESWDGLPSLAAALTPVQREKIEECGKRHQRSILQQVISNVSAASFAEYSTIMEDVTWSSGETLHVPEENFGAPFGAHQAAS